MRFEISELVTFDSLEELFEVSSFLDNTETLLGDFTPEVSKILVNESFFPSGFMKKTYDLQFEELITRLIKRQVIQHFTTFTPDKITNLTEPALLKLLAPELYIQDNYKTAKKAALN